MKTYDISADKSVLITGGSGLVGKYLTSLLLSKGYSVSHLSRKANLFGRVRVFRWDPVKKILDPQIFNGIKYLIHLAGADIGEKRWTKKRKEEIFSSRIDSARLLYNVIHENGIKLNAFITASATGYYGALTTEKIFTEEEMPASDFLGTICRLWEDTADLFDKSGVRTVKIRTSVVLAKESKALLKLLMPLKTGFLVRVGKGKQYMPWIHISDLCNIYLKAIEDIRLHGAYNAVSPQHTDHDTFMKTISGIINKPLLRLHVPGWLIRLAIGEMADVILEGTRVSSEKITGTGFAFNYAVLRNALYDILKEA